MAHRDFENLDISDTDEDLFASPSRSPSRNRRPGAQTPADIPPPPPRMPESRHDAEAARAAALERELASLRHMNAVVEDVIGSLSVAKTDLGSVSTTVASASTLLNTWTRILSQTEHNQRLILDPAWQGASRDVADAENDAVMRRQAAERRAAEELRRREEARARAEDEERQRQAGTAMRGVRGSRARGRGVGRGASSGYGGVGQGTAAGLGLGRGASQVGRGGSGIGRGIPSTRGRARGVR